jgi:hypothetical protein
MKTASQLSKEIRSKKKQSASQDKGIVDLSGIPEDATDLEHIKAESLTKDLGLDHNSPKAHSEEPDTMNKPASHQSLMEDSAERQAAVMSDEAKKKRMQRLSGKMSF